MLVTFVSLVSDQFSVENISVHQFEILEGGENYRVVINDVDTEQKILVFYSIREKTSPEHKVLNDKLKTVVPALILKKKKSRPPTSQNFKIIRLLLCNDFFRINIQLTYINYTP